MSDIDELQAKIEEANKLHEKFKEKLTEAAITTQKNVEEHQTEQDKRLDKLEEQSNNPE